MGLYKERQSEIQAMYAKFLRRIEGKTRRDRIINEIFGEET
jgi:hypothetical protein